MKKSLRDRIPLATSPLQRSPKLLEWICSWMGDDKEWEFATPMDWHYNAHQSEVVTLDGKTKTWIWDLPPAAAHYALEELAMARTKRRELLQGIVIIPNLLTPEWTRRLSKTVDIYFRIPAGSLPGWPDEMHEALTIGLYFPTFRHRPWDWRNVGWMGELGRLLSGMFKGDPARGRNILHNFWNATSPVGDLSPGMVWRLLSAPSWVPLCSACFDGRGWESDD